MSPIVANVTNVIPTQNTEPAEIVFVHAFGNTSTNVIHTLVEPLCAPVLTLQVSWIRLTDPGACKPLIGKPDG